MDEDNDGTSPDDSPVEVRPRPGPRPGVHGTWRGSRPGQGWQSGRLSRLPGHRACRAAGCKGRRMLKDKQRNINHS
jgi:hypothetical protein